MDVTSLKAWRTVGFMSQTQQKSGCCQQKSTRNWGDMVMAPGVYIKILGVDFLHHKMFTLGVFFIGFDSSPYGGTQGHRCHQLDAGQWGTTW
jgi:hypothetical protein